LRLRYPGTLSAAGEPPGAAQAARRDRRHPGPGASDERRRRHVRDRGRAARIPQGAPGIDPLGAGLARPRRGLSRDPGVAGAHAEAQRLDPEAEEAELDAAELERLRSLGYL